MTQIVQDTLTNQAVGSRRTTSGNKETDGRNHAFQDALSDASSEEELRPKREPTMRRPMATTDAGGLTHRSAAAAAGIRDNDQPSMRPALTATERRSDNVSEERERSTPRDTRMPTSLRSPIRFEGDLRRDQSPPEPPSRAQFLAAVSSAALDDPDEGHGNNNLSGGSARPPEHSFGDAVRRAFSLSELADTTARGSDRPTQQNGTSQPEGATPAFLTNAVNGRVAPTTATNQQAPEPSRHLLLQAEQTGTQVYASDDLRAPSRDLVSFALPGVAARTEQGRNEAPSDRGRRLNPSRTVHFTRGGHSSHAATANAPANATTEAPAPNVTVNIVRQEVHLPPVRSSLSAEAADNANLARPSSGTVETVLTQLKAGLLAERAADPAATPQSQSEPGGGRQLSGAPNLPNQVVKVVELMLRPASLGLLTVTMRLTPSGLRVGVNASERETAELLGSNEHALKTLLTEAGYEIDQLDISFNASTLTAEQRPLPLFGGRV